MPGGAAGDVPPRRPRAAAAGAADAPRLAAGAVLPAPWSAGLGDWDGDGESGDSRAFKALKDRNSLVSEW